MPDVKCPRCGAAMVRDWPGRGGHLLAYNVIHSDNAPGADIYRCPCGPLVVVEGDRVAWYYPADPSLGALLDKAWLALETRDGTGTAKDAIDTYYAAHPEARL